MGLQLHHLHVRKRHSHSLEPYPARTQWKRWLDKTVYAAGIIGPIMSLPQIIRIYGTGSADGIAPESWFMWALLDIPWIIYGLVHREFPIAMTYILWLLCNTLVLVGALLY